MTSLFDDAGASWRSELPVDLIAGGGRGVALLEFATLEEEAEQKAGSDGARERDSEAVDFATHARATQVAAMIDAARSEAEAEAREDFAAELETRLAEERRRVATMCADFAHDRARYFAAAEQQVVKLALAVAGRVLTREVEADAFHMAATVRAALSRVHGASASTLRVHPAECAGWRALFGSGRESPVEVVAEDQMQRGECVLETNVGRVELGVGVQLAEIERGFGELTERQGA